MPQLPDPFDPARTAGRRAALARRLRADHDGAAMVVSDPLNIRYLCGFDGSNGALLIDGDEAVLFTDFRYLLQAAGQSPGIPVLEARAVVAAALDRCRGPVLLEGHHISAGMWRSLADRPVELVDDIVAGLRSVKDDAEIAVLERACRISEDALTQLLAQGVLGVSERDLARRLEWLLGEGPGEGPGFSSIVAAGRSSAVPHHQPSDRVVARGDLLTIDFGARVRGYHADITRTYVVGAEPRPWQRRIHELVLAAQRAGRESVADGAPITAVDAAARRLIADAGHAEHFGHGLGHGVGLAIHERPLIAGSVAGTLAAGMAVTIEPGVYLPGRGGVRIEDTVLVTATGCRSLVALPRELTTVA